MKTDYYNIKIVFRNCYFPNDMYIYSYLVGMHFRIPLYKRRAPRKKLTRKSIKILLGIARQTYLDFEEFSNLKLLKTEKSIEYEI